MMSLGPPGGNGTISRMVLSGKSAAAIDAGKTRSNPAASAPTIFMQGSALKSGSALSGIEQLERCLVHALVAGRHDAAAPWRRAAFPRGDDAAGAGDDRDQRGDVVGLEFGFDDEIEMTGSEHAIGIAVAAVTCQPHRLFDAAEGGAISRVHQQWAGGEQGRILQRGAPAHR